MEFQEEQELYRSLLKDKEIIQEGGIEAFRHILKKLDDAAELMLKEYDAVDFARHPEKAINIQAFRRVVKIEIPQMVERIMSVDIPDSVPRFSFRNWLNKLFVKENTNA
jgi:hypothetical protein